MKQSNNNVKQVRVYHEESARIKRVNLYILTGLIMMYSVFIYAIISSLISMKSKDGIFYANIIALGLCFICMIINYIFYKKSPISKTYRFIAVVGFLSVYAIMIFATTDYYVLIGAIAFFMGCIMYFDKMFSRAFASVMLLLFLIRTIISIQSGDSSSINLEVIRLLMLLMITTTLGFDSKIGKVFIDDTVGVVMDQRNSINDILSEVLKLSGIVKTNIDKTSIIINELNESTDTVNSAVEEIANSTTSVTQSIIEQTQMTSEIQNNIMNTQNISNQAVEIVQESSRAITDSLLISRQLKDNSEEIASISHDVSDAMSELQSKVQAVNDIIGVILGISSQTNLLALNASIEAARAGESGRGFAVVADEIGSLSKRTKESTEDISNILQELNEKASYASKIVNRSIDVTTNQNNSINDVTVSIDRVNTNMTVLYDNISDINNKINVIANSNQIIVDNVTQVSAVCEEITASTENASGITNQSKSMAEKAVEMLNEVLDAASKLDKYNTAKTE